MFFSRTGCERGQPGGTGRLGTRIQHLQKQGACHSGQDLRIWTDQNILTSQGLLLQFWSLSESHVNVMQSSM